jgi:hypothetical protein
MRAGESRLLEFLRGRRLLTKKSKLAHGEWIPWVEANLAFGISMAQKCMDVARKDTERKVNAESAIPHLTKIGEPVSRSTAGKVNAHRFYRIGEH